MKMALAAERDSFFFLKQVCAGGHRGLRACCSLERSSRIVSASYDGYICIWARPNSSSSSTSTSHLSSAFSIEEQYRLCEGPIYAVIDGSNVKTSDSEESFFAGTQQHVLWVHISGTILHTFQGHTASVSSLCITRLSAGPDKQHCSSVLVSGSWDGTARVWDLSTFNCLYTLTGHSYAVTVFAWRRPDSHYTEIVTGSQDKCIRFWSLENRFEKPVATLPDAHEDIIRGFTLLSETNVATCSNDGYANVWDFEKRKKVATNRIHDTFTFDIATLRSWRNGKFELCVVSSSEDNSVSIWNANSNSWALLQTLRHPATVWRVHLVDNGDLLTLCDDGQLRVWTQDSSCALPKEQREAEEALAQASVPAASGSIDVSKLPDVSLLSAQRGTHSGQHRLFRDNDVAVAYVWADDHWDRVGDVVDQPAASSKVYYEGDSVFPADYYDYVFQVELGTAALPKPLPYALHQNTLATAEAFCAREGLSKIYVSEIVQFIEQNTPRAATLGPPVKQQSRLAKKYCVSRDYLSFTSTNIPALREKIKEFNQQLTSDGLALSDLEMSYLDALLSKVASSRFLFSELRQCELDVVFQSHLKRWPSAMLLPVIDLWRILSLHPQSSDTYKKTDGGWQFIHFALQQITQSSDQPSALTICCYRYLANLYILPTNRDAALRYTLEILRDMQEPPKGKLTAAIAWSAVLLNLTLAVFQAKDTVFGYMAGKSESVHPMESILSTVARAITAALAAKLDDASLVYRLCVSFGTLLSASHARMVMKQNDALTHDLNETYGALRRAITSVAQNEELSMCFEEVEIALMS